MYTLPTWERVLVVTKGLGFGTSLSFDGQLLVVGRVDDDLRTDAESVAWTYEDAAPASAGVIYSPFLVSLACVPRH